MSTESAAALNQFCVTILGGLLAAGDWYENPGQLYRAGQIQEEVLPDVPREPRLLRKFTAAGYPIDVTEDEMQRHDEAHKAWSVAPAPWRRPPTPKEVEVIKTCVKKFADSKKLGGSIHLLPLLRLAALRPED